ncbi:gliding motility-associated C-terminal domain-containing protein [Flavobacteriaceae bacterium]|nr:gliding motility-associated C-terminal domain-containing protein [Flavobacteriaceae bacterium]
MPGVWFNNTVCQDNLPAPTTASSEFFACFVNDGLNRQFNSYEWNWTPTNAGVITSNDFQETTVGIVETGVGSTVGVDYAVIITANSITNTYTFTTTVASQSADIVGLELSNLIDVNANVSSIYNNISNQIIIESLSANTAFTVQSTPTGTDQFLRLLAPVTTQIGRSGTMIWDPSFSGTATIRVRSSGCDGNSGWLEVEIDVVPETVVATPTSSDLLEPEAFDFQVCGGAFTGPIPECQIIATTPDTQFFTASDNGTDPNDFASLEWQVSNPQPGLGSLVSSPGTIDQATGNMQWSVGWYGSFELQVRPVSCSGVTGDWKSRTIVIGAQDGPVMSVTPVGLDALPLCPIPAAGFSTTLTTGGQAVRWFINSPVGLTTDTTYVASATFFELPASGAASDTLVLDYRPGFSGNIIISVEPIPCPGDRVNYVISVPVAPQITLTSGFNSNNITLCEDTAISTITYEIEGAANNVTASGLPTGLNYDMIITSQQTSISIDTDSTTSIGQTYSISINNNPFSFTTTAAVANANDHIGQGLVDVVNAATNDFVLTYVAGTISIAVGPTGQSGNSFIISTTQPLNSSVTFGTPVANPLSKILRIYGTPSITSTRLFTFNIETEPMQTGCETAIATGTIIVNENASITVEQGAAENNNVCGTSVFTGTESIILSHDVNSLGIELSPTSPDLLPNGLVLTREVGSFNRFEISGTLNEVVAVTTQFNVDFITTGANCAEATQRIIFNIEPTPVVTLTSTSSLGTNRAPCVSEEMIPIRFEIANPAFLLTVTPTGIDPFPAGIVGTNYAQNQITRVGIMLAGPVPLTTVISDTHTLIINGTPYTSNSTGTDDITDLTERLVNELSAQLSPTILVTNNDPFIEFEAVNPGFAFSLSTQSSSNLVFDSPVGTITQPPAYYEISGTPTEIVTTSTEYVYNLKSVGPTGDCSDSFSASGTITINPTASASFISGVGLNPVLCDSGIGGTSVFQAVGRPIGLSAVHTETWIIASLDQTSQEITISYNPPIQNNTSIVSFTYQFNLIGGLADLCASGNASITGVVYISPEDSITFTGILGEDAQIVCVNNDANLSSFIPVEFLLAGGATTVSTISFTQDGGVSQSGLPPGFSYSVIGDTVRITGVATEDAAVPTATSTVYEYLIETGPGLCASGTVTGTIEVVSEPTLALASSVGTDDQIICDNTAFETIVYEMGGGATQSTLTFTGSNTLFGSGSFTANASGTNQYVIYGTPSVNVTESTIYSYQIQTVGSDCVSEVILTGSIQIDPLDDISLISSPTTNNQTVCFMDRDNTGELTAELFAPIEYQLIGGAIGDSVTVSYTVDGGTSIAGLPAGLGYETTASNTILISGSINVSTTFTASPTVVYTYSITTEGDCSPPVTVTGDITVLSPPLMSLVSSATTANQVICDGTPIDTITYEFSGGASMIGFNWTGSNTLFGSGISTSNFGVNQYIIQGTPTVNVTQSTIYTYEVVTVGSACVSEVVLTGSIQVEPTDGLSLISAINTDNQSICLFDRDNAGNAIAENFIPIEYQLEGGAIGATYSISYQVDGGTAQLGLPAGLGHSLTTSNTILIEGTIVASTTFSSPTVTYNYTITTNGSCVTDTISGNLTVYSPPIMTLTSAVTTTNQVGFFSVCNIAEPIADIVYTFEGGATNAVFSWTGPTLTGVSGSITSGTNSMVISGIPSVNIATTTQYPYQVTTEGSACASEVIYTGVIEVKPEEILTLASLPATENQTICAGTGSNTLDPIIYTLGQEATNAIVTFTPPIPGVGYTVSGTQVIISGVAAAAAQASKTILNYIYRIETTGCGNVLGSNIDGGTITILPTPVMELASGTPYFTVCQSDIDADIADVDYVFNPESNAIPIIAWDVYPGFNLYPVSGDTTLYRLSGAPSVNISSTTTYNYTITLSGDCDPDVVLTGAVTIDPGPQINSAFIENNLLTDISCFGANDGSIELGDPTGQDFLNSIQNINLGTVQESSVTFAGAITYDDIFRVTIDGTEYTTRGGEISAGTTITYTQTQVVNGLRASINNDPSQTNLFASQSGFGLNVNGLTEGLAFTISANTGDTSFVTNTVTTTTDAEYYAPQVTWLLADGTTRSGLNIYDLTPGLYELNVTVDTCISTASFEIKEPTELSFTTAVCNSVLTLTATGSIIDPSDKPDYEFKVYDVDGRVIEPILPQRPGVPVEYIVGLKEFVTIQLSTENCTIRESFQMGAGEIELDRDNVITTDSVCATNSLQVGSIDVTGLVTGGSGYYEYRWTNSDLGTDVLMGTQPLLSNVPPGSYNLEISDLLNSTCSVKYLNFPVLGITPVILTGVETAQFQPAGPLDTVDYVYTLTCNGDSATFELRASGGYPESVYTIVRTNPIIPYPVGSPIKIQSAGTYVFEATSNSISGLGCSAQITIRIDEPAEYGFELSYNLMPTCPEDLVTGGELIYTISGFNPLAIPYTVSLNNGLFSAETNTKTVEFTNIDVTDPLFRTINTIEITDRFGCSTGLLPTAFTFDEVSQYELTDLSYFDIDCTIETSGDLSFNVNAVTPAPIINYEAELHIEGVAYAFDRRLIFKLTDGIDEENFFTWPDDYTYTISLIGSSTCEIASGTIPIASANNAQLLVYPPGVRQPVCGSSSQVSLTIENEINPLSIHWFRFTTTTTSTQDIRGITTNATTTRAWVPVLDYDGFAVLDNVPAGTYRAIISDARDSDCSGGEFVTPNILIQESDKPYDVQVFSSYMPQCPEDLAIGGELIYQITGVDTSIATYTVKLNGGLLEADSDPDYRVTFSNIDVTNPLLKTINLIEIVDGFGCSSAIIDDVVFTFDSVYQYEVVNFSKSNIDCSLDTSGELSFGIYPAAINTNAPQISTSNSGTLYIRGEGGNYEYYETITSPDVMVDNFRTADEYFYSVTLNGTTTCAAVTGTFTIAEANNALLRVAPPEVTLPGCGVTESQIKLSITNAITPLSIRWYEFTSTTSSVIDTAGITVNATTTTNWFEIPEYEGLSILNNVPSGIYRAIVSDSRDNSCLGGVFVTRNILISEGNISVSNFRTTENIPSIGSGVCKNYPTPSTGSIDWNSTRDAYTNDVFFNVNLNVNRSGNVTQTRNTGIYMSLTGPDGAAVPLNNPSIFGGRIVTNNGRYISLEPSSYPYRFRNLPSGNYTLIVEENVDGTDLIPCTEVFFFTVREYLPIQYTGDTVFVTDLCTGFVDGGIRAAATGGNPFIIDGIQTYQFEWTFTPNDPNQSSQVFYGELVERAMPGNYCLRILDQNGHSYCSCDANETSPVTIVVEDVVEPFSVQGTLTDPAQPGTLVRSLPPECSSGGFDGRIGIQITGGQLPYTIKWYVEDPRELASGDGYRELPEYQNSTSLQNLLPGNYKVEISSSINQCGGINAYSYFTDTIQVSPNRELYIMEGPFVDEDLCTGEQGRLIVDIFDNNNGNLSFYYNDILIPNSDVIRLSDRSWSIAIVNAVETADFRVANQEGCWITTSISRGIGVPNFTYTTPNFAASSIVLAREEITFENTSTDPFVTSEWIFGDNSTPQIVPTLNDSIIPVRHTYGVSGTYFTTLRLYNNIGCSEEITLPISVGKGYNIMVPNVFTPNNDLVNDNFKPLFSGFSNMTFTVYDYRGNVVYNEYVEESDLNNIQGISITGWDGSLAPYSPYFIYTAFGVLLDGETEVEKSGTFIVIN